MLHKVIAIYDRKAQAFQKPVTAVSAGAAVRSFGDAVNEPSTDFSRHPEDYSIWELGSYNDDTGQFNCDGEKDKKMLAEASSLLHTDTKHTVRS